MDNGEMRMCLLLARSISTAAGTLEGELEMVRC